MIKYIFFSFILSLQVLHAGIREKCISKFLQMAEKSSEKVDAWKFSDEEEQSFKAVFSRSAKDEELVSEVLHELMKARFKQFNSVSKFFIKAGARKHGFYARTIGYWIAKFFGPHYHPVFNSIAYGHYEKNALLSDIVAAHEIGHVMQRNASLWFPILFISFPFDIKSLIFRTPLTPMIRFRIESEAIGNQWELTSRIPESIRNNLIIKLSNDYVADPFEQQLTANYLSEERDERIAAGEKISKDELKRVRKIIKSSRQIGQSITWTETRSATIAAALRKGALESLKNAHLSKPEFIKKLRKTHGYELKSFLSNHYLKVDFFRVFILIGTLIFLKDIPSEQWSLYLPAEDLKLLLYYLGM